MTNQSDRQASIRAVTGTAYSYEGDWHALWDSLGIPQIDFNERMLLWINMVLSTSYTEVNGAMAALAQAAGVANWDSLGDLSQFLGSLFFTNNTYTNQYFTDNGYQNPYQTSGGTPVQLQNYNFVSNSPSAISSYSRATTNEFYRNSAGKFVLAAANEIRHDHDFDGSPIGMRYDHVSTNKCTNTNWNMVDLTGLTTAGNASAVVSISTHPVHGHPVILVDNTLGGSGSVNVTTTGQFGNTNVHSMRTVARVLSGAFTGTFISDSGGSFVKTAADCGVTTLNTDCFIFNEGFVPANATRTMRFVCALGCKAMFWLNQLEELEVCTFPLLVAGSTATRTAAASYQLLSSIPSYTEVKGSLVVEAVFDRVTNTANQYIIQIANGASTAETLGLYAVSGSYGQVRACTAIASGSQTNNDVHCPIRGKRFPMAFSWQSGQTLSVAGPMSWTLATYTGSPTGMTRLNIGGRGATEPFQGWIRSITVFDQPQTINQLGAYMFPSVRTYRGMPISGQSNGKGLFRSTETKQNGGEVAAVAAMDAVYTDSENWALCCAIDGAAADRSNDGASGYTNWFYDRATGTFGPAMIYAKSVMTAFGLGNVLKVVGWDQGATDAGDTIANLKISTKAIFDEWVNFLGAGTKSVVHPIARRQDNYYDIYETVKAAQRQLADENPTYVFEAPPQDNVICGSDNIHLSNASYGTGATQLWRKMLVVLGNVLTGPVDPPRFTSASRSGTTVTVPITFPSGMTALTPTSGILGFRCFNGDPSLGNAEISVTAATYATGNVTLTLATTPTNPLYVQYARGGLYFEFLAGGSANPIANLARGNDANGLGLAWNKIVST